MMELYQQYLHRIKMMYKEINGTREKIIFLIEERNHFRQNNKNASADIIIHWFTD